MPTTKVAILGGGVGGMSAAHELAERGFDIDVYEKQLLPGGKAREIPVLEPGERFESNSIKEAAYFRNYVVNRGWAAAGPQPWLPGEHGFRFFPSFYRHVIDTMKRIPFKHGNVADNLTDTSSVLFSRFEKPAIELPCRFPRTIAEFKLIFDQFLAVLAGSAVMPSEEVLFFASRIWQVITSCEERRLAEYEKVQWWTFIDAAHKSNDYQRLLGYGITRCLVAAQADKASTRTIGDIFLQLILGIVDPAVGSSDRVLNQPTNRAWLGPWFDHLRNIGVRYHLETAVTAINCCDGRIRDVIVESDGRKKSITADYYICALPVEDLASLITTRIAAADPHLANLPELAKNVEWMNGIQFYLRSDVTLAHGHVIHADSPWALTSISQAQFWTDVDLAQRGDGKVRGIISVDISDWDTPGLNGKAAAACSREEVANEVWNQLKRSLNRPEAEALQDGNLYFWYLDPDIVVHPVDRSTDIEPLLVNYADTWKLRPEAVTAIPNLFLASDYVRTSTDLATMEGANEAARRAVNGILDTSGSGAPRCRLWSLYEPIIFEPFRAYDRARWAAGLPWDGQFVDCIVALLNAAIEASKSITSEEILQLATKFSALQPADESSLSRGSKGRPRIHIVPC